MSLSLSNELEAPNKIYLKQFIPTELAKQNWISH